ncbi:MAG: hypothetical protein J6M14_04290 [Campylobacter sp.]|nr:hypothetical protein [Campylobacter sp.]
MANSKNRTDRIEYLKKNGGLPTRTFLTMFNLQHDKLNIEATINFQYDILFTDDFLLKYYNLPYIAKIEDFENWFINNVEFLDDDKKIQQRYKKYDDYFMKKIKQKPLPFVETWIDRLNLKKTIDKK